jgi:NHS family xanthosine MFS transporter
VWGTVGFIAAMWFVDLVYIDGVQIKQTYWQLYVSAFLSVILAAYSFTLPNCAVSRVAQKKSWVDTLGLRAFALFKQKRMAIFFIFSMLLGAALQITNAFGDSYIQSFGAITQYADSLVVKHSVILLSLSQISETLCILLIPFFLRRYGIKKVMLISMIAWVLRFGFFGIGNPGWGASFLVLSMIVYGVAFDFFNISGSLFVEKETAREIRSSAQGVFMIMTNGFGAFFGSYAAGAVVDKFGWPNSWFIFAFYALVVAIVFAMVFKYKHDPKQTVAVKH